MEDYKQLLLRAKNVPYLKIETKEIDNKAKIKKEFDGTDLKPYIKTGARLNENTIELPLWDDEQIFNEVIPAWGFHKFCNYEVKEFGLGLVYVRFKFGKKVRKGNDFRFREDKDVQQIDFYFIYDFEKRQYVEINPLKNDEWQKRISNMELLEKQTFPFTWNYLTQIRPAFLESHDKFGKNYSRTYSDIAIHLKGLDKFLDDTGLYIDLLYIIYGDITKDEHFTLEQAIRRQKKLISKTREYIEAFKEDALFDAHKDYYDRHDEKAALGITTGTFFDFEKIIKARKEKIDDHEWFSYNKMQGYLTVNKEKNVLYPNFTEVERRRSLYKQAGNNESENMTINEIIKRLK